MAVTVVRSGCNLFSLSLFSFVFFLSLCFSLLSSSSGLLFFLSFGIFPLFSFFPRFSSRFSLPPCALLLPCIYRKTGERHGWGDHCAAPSNRPRGTSPPFFHHMASKWVVSVFLRESWRWNRRKNLLLLPLRRASRGRRRHGCRSKRHCFKLLFFL